MKLKILFFCLGLILSLEKGKFIPISGAEEAQPQMAHVRELYLSGQLDQAWLELQPVLDSKKMEDEKGRAYLLAGQILLSLGKVEEARQALEKGVVLKSNLSSYYFYLLGQSYIKLNRLRDGRTALERVSYFKPPAELRYQVRNLLGEIALQEHQWKEADRHYAYLERKWRRSPQTPHILWRRLQVNLARKNQGQVCRLARRLYAFYPQNPLIYDWTIELQNAVVEGQRLGCVASHQDKATRIRRFQLAGEFERARREIDLLRGQGHPADVEFSDMMKVNFLTFDGYPDEALTLLAKYYNTHKNDINYLLNLAQAASRGGEFQTAVGTYLKVHALAPHQRWGREALFQAAFLSYQFQDYDGAARHFKKFIEKYSRSGLVRDAKWHLAWLRYLRGDFEGAYLSLEQLKSFSSRRQKLSVHDDRITYWMAMALARSGKAIEAKELFTNLEKSDSSSFYALAARARREKLPASRIKSETPLQSLTSRRLNGPFLISGIDSYLYDTPQMEVETEITAETEETMLLNRDTTTEIHLSPEVIGKKDGPEKETQEEGDEGEETSSIDLSDDGSMDSDEDEKIQVTDFKDPRLRKHFEVAQDLVVIGFIDWARHELFEVERRTKNLSYLKMLIKNYEDINSFHRSSSLGELAFAQERLQMGFRGARGLWESTYPQAYRDLVEKFAHQFDVSRDWIWSIMRAESHFKPDVMSPVGAKGLMQIMPDTGRQVARLLGEENNFQVMSLLNPETNVRLGARYLARLATKYKKSLPLVAAAYNAGPHRVDSWLANFGYLETDEFIEHIPFLETRNYVKKVIRNLSVYRNLYNSDRQVLAWLVESVPVQINGRPLTRESWDTL